MKPSDDRARMQQLFIELCRLVHDELDEIGLDLDRAQRIVGDAGMRLSSDVTKLGVVSKVQQETVEEAVAKAPVAANPGSERAAAFAGPPEASAHIARGLRQTVDRSVRHNITSLQFEDMTRQLLGRIAARITELDGLVDSLRKGAASLAPGSEEVVEAALRELEAKLAEGVRRVPNAVVQDSMQAGDTELF